jgi:hypothetical protein
MKILGILLCTALAAPSSVYGQEIAINYNDAQGTSENITSATGVISVAADDWNNVSQYQTGQTYFDSTGTDLPNFTLTNSSAGTYSTGVTDLGNLFNAYNDGASGFTVNGVPYTASGYDVYIYVGSNGDGRDAQGTIGSETLTFSSMTGSSADLASGFTVNSTPDTLYSPYNTLEFTGLTASSFTYTESYVNQAVGIFGIEIVAAPEPSTWALMLVGVLGLLFFVRRNRALLNC